MKNKDQIVKELSDLMIKYSFGNIYCASEEGVVELIFKEKQVRNDRLIPAKIQVNITPSVKREEMEVSINN